MAHARRAARLVLPTMPGIALGLMLLNAAAEPLCQRNSGDVDYRLFRVLIARR
jgi:hypothetical protein